MHATRQYGVYGDHYIRVKIRIEDVVRILYAWNKKYVSVKEVSCKLGLSRQAAGKILARLESLGLIDKYSHGVYKLKIE